MKRVYWAAVLSNLGATLVFQAAMVGAADSGSAVTRLEDITVLSTPLIEGNETDRYAGEKTTVTESQIEDLNAQDLGGALRMAPGVNISRYNMVGAFGGASGGAVFIRGMGSSRPGAEIKLLVDGIPMYMSVWNHPLLDLMSIDSASAIEVYKSPQPHIFGNATSVVNLVPKRRIQDGFVTSAGVSGGSYDTFVAKGEHGGKVNKFDYYLGGGYRTSDGHRDNADGETQNIYGRMGYSFSDHLNCSVFGLWNDNYADDPGKVGESPEKRQGRYETGAWLGVFTIENRFDVAEGHVKFYRNSGEGDWLDQPTSAPGVREDLFNDFLFYGVKAREMFRFWKGGEIIAGFDYDVTEGDYDKTRTNGTTERWEEHDFSIASPYLALSQQIGSREGFFLIPSAGARYYHNSDFDPEWSPHAGLILGHQETELHGGYSRGVVYPGLDVMVLSEMVTPALKTSWQNLTAETVDHYEIGIRHRFGKLAIADITGFYENGKDRYVVVPGTPPVFANIEEFRIRGVEFTASVYPLDDLALFGGVTYLDTEPSDLPYAPELTLSAGLNWRFLKSFKLSLDCQYVDEMYVDSQARRKDAKNTATVDSYFLVNGKISYGFIWASTRVKAEVFLAGENLTDADYEYLPGYPMPGVTGMGGLTVRF